MIPAKRPGLFKSDRKLKKKRDHSISRSRSKTPKARSLSSSQSISRSPSRSHSLSRSCSSAPEPRKRVGLFRAKKNKTPESGSDSPAPKKTSYRAVSDYSESETANKNRTKPGLFMLKPKQVEPPQNSDYESDIELSSSERILAPKGRGRGVFKVKPEESLSEASSIFENVDKVEKKVGRTRKKVCLSIGYNNFSGFLTITCLARVKAEGEIFRGKQ